MICNGQVPMQPRWAAIVNCSSCSSIQHLNSTFTILHLAFFFEAYAVFSHWFWKETIALYSSGSFALTATTHTKYYWGPTC